MQLQGQPRTPDRVVADNVRDFRSLARLSQGALADRMRVVGHGWHQKTVSHVEAGRRSVSVGELWSLSFVLGVTMADLLDPTGPDGRNRDGVRLGDPDLSEERIAAYGGALNLTWTAARLVAHSRKRIPWQPDLFEDSDELDADDPVRNVGGPGPVGYDEDDIAFLGLRSAPDEGDDQ